MKEWLRRKLASFLGVDELEYKYHNLLVKYQKLETNFEDLKSLNRQVVAENSFILKQFDMSADIYHSTRERSWAVISIQGKPEYVKFLDLSNSDMREIHRFLKMYERTNRTIDSPINFLKF